MSFIKDFNNDAMTDVQRHQRFLLVLFAEVIIVGFMTFVTVSDFVDGNASYQFFSVILLILYALALFFSAITKGSKISNVFFCCTVASNFLYSFYIKGNNGVGTIWLLLLPVLTMYIIGLSYGFYSSLFAVLGLLVLFFIPYTRKNLLALYSANFLFRYIILYIIDFFLSVVSMYNFHTLRRKESENQKLLEAAVAAEHNKVVSISMQTIIAISNAVEAKNINVGKHSLRVAHFSCLIAEKMGWPEDEIRRLHTIAMLHDIGKIGIDSKILNKKSSLNDDEFEKMKEHTVIGGKILKGLTIIPQVDAGANYHHEHYDGKGYPEGLTGGNIPVEARIICVADSFDSMKYPRGFKVSLNKDSIKNELLKGRGSQFDPEIADIFLRLCDENNWFEDFEV